MKKMHKTTETPARSWQMSFNDLLTVMLTFFILLVSISNIRADKVDNLSASASTVFGAREIADPRTTFIRNIGAIEGVNAHMVEGGVSVVLHESLLYHSGSADIIHKHVLSRLGGALKTAGGQIRVEGHTDSLPVANGSFPSNWELSTQRAVNVVKFLAGECKVDPANLSAAGYGDTRPVAVNESPEGRALNRRVNIIISIK
jgi:chemotaxis protein MotB